MSIWWAKSQTDQLQPMKTNCSGLNCYKQYTRWGEEKEDTSDQCEKAFPLIQQAHTSLQDAQAPAERTGAFFLGINRVESQIDATVQEVYGGKFHNCCWSKWYSKIYLHICPFLLFFFTSFKASNFITLPSKYFHHLAVSSYSEVRSMPSFSL